jgi:hypothetical protein
MAIPVRESKSLRCVIKSVGSHFEFSANDTRIGSFDDTRFVAGQVALVASSNDDCVFTHLVITRA